MFILSLTYIAPLEDADKHMDAHMAWVREGYDGNFFLASGRKIPRTGGVILARGQREMIEDMCAADPFVIHKIAEYEIIEVAFTTVAHGIEILKT
ncbi:GTP cyclohydrolase [Rhizobium sp. TH2]|uniref:YciI family protein n=1 Tax=Rhizobium sp. TH2 TaxID=2775403 RepID=UPI002157C1EC|nr:YciI family protein [Rhizobium sp. TH2]UVC07676.1 GTP cyclohydrolase [Rhizobium sp. TH2]